MGLIIILVVLLLFFAGNYVGQIQTDKQRRHAYERINSILIEENNRNDYTAKTITEDKEQKWLYWLDFSTWP